MTDATFKEPKIAEVETYMLKFVHSLADKYPALLDLDLNFKARLCLARRENWEAGETEEKLKDWRTAAKREVIRDFYYIPFTEALDIELTEDQKLEIEDEMFIRCTNRECDEAEIESKLKEIKKALSEIELRIKG